MTIVRFMVAAVLLSVFAGRFAAAQDPSLFLSLAGFTLWHRLRTLLAVFVFASAASTSASALPPGDGPADVVVYGGTASGVMTAYTAAKRGKHVVLLEPTQHLGGMVTGGLSATDSGYFPIIGGYTREFYSEAARQYGKTNLDHAADWLSEPKVGEAIFQEWLKAAGVQVHLGERLKERGGVERKGTQITSIVMESGARWTGKIFIDCSYEGDVMAQAHIRYTVGREGSEVFGEDLAGVRLDTPKHQFLYRTSARDETGKLYPEVDAGPLEAKGTGDRKVQSYNFRMILTDDPANRLPWEKPAGYDPRRFALLARYLSEYKLHTGNDPVLRTVTNPSCFAHHKCDFNNNGAFSTDYLGRSWSYPDSDYAGRARIRDEHMLYTQSFFYFIATDPSVPQSLRDDANKWGRAKDEFVDSDNWPRQLYIREGRRMRGVYVMRQADLQTELTKPDSIAMGSYNSDSHNVDRLALADGSVFNEGDVQVPVKPYEISYRAILPAAEQATNLLVPVCLSASHVAYSSVRMEPQYMMIGEAAGNAAALAIDEGTAVKKVSVDKLQKALVAEGAILHIAQQHKAAATDKAN
jgi:hypothetical protein